MKFYPFILSFLTDLLIILPCGVYLLWLAMDLEMAEKNLIMGLGIALFSHLCLKYGALWIRKTLVASVNQILTFPLIIFLILGLLFNLAEAPASLLLTNLALLAATGLNLLFFQEWKKVLAQRPLI